jgi:hypothetical protein
MMQDDGIALTNRGGEIFGLTFQLDGQPCASSRRRCLVLGTLGNQTMEHGVHVRLE